MTEKYEINFSYKILCENNGINIMIEQDKKEINFHGRRYRDI